MKLISNFIPVVALGDAVTRRVIVKWSRIALGKMGRRNIPLWILCLLNIVATGLPFGTAVVIRQINAWRKEVIQHAPSASARYSILPIIHVALSLVVALCTSIVAWESKAALRAFATGIGFTVYLIDVVLVPIFFTFILPAPKFAGCVAGFVKKDGISEELAEKGCRLFTGPLYGLTIAELCILAVVVGMWIPVLSQKRPTPAIHSNSPVYSTSWPPVRPSATVISESHKLGALYNRDGTDRSSTVKQEAPEYTQEDTKLLRSSKTPSVPASDDLNTATTLEQNHLEDARLKDGAAMAYLKRLWTRWTWTASRKVIFILLNLNHSVIHLVLTMGVAIVGGDLTSWRHEIIPTIKDPQNAPFLAKDYTLLPGLHLGLSIIVLSCSTFLLMQLSKLYLILIAAIGYTSYITDIIIMPIYFLLVLPSPNFGGCYYWFTKSQAVSNDTAAHACHLLTGPLYGFAIADMCVMTMIVGMWALILRGATRTSSPSTTLSISILSTAQLDGKD
ncbi:hypothetical protein CVT26_009026 [Gymnopilus dilepis]|uniref:Uncharacterized protein n=1 Tax=Gymnopilus dilepis TaxID=231916 RepID=A0A409YB92_9AGAR|nr:hypothetical protein CVT26_009026 [Gymnopilus dilepis]